MWNKSIGSMGRCYVAAWPGNEQGWVEGGKKTQTEAQNTRTYLLLVVEAAVAHLLLELERPLRGPRHCPAVVPGVAAVALCGVCECLRVCDFTLCVFVCKHRNAPAAALTRSRPWMQRRKRRSGSRSSLALTGAKKSTACGCVCVFECAVVVR